MEIYRLRKVCVPLQRVTLVAQLVNKPPAMWETLGSSPGLGRSPGEGKSYPLQYSGLENPMDCIVHGVTNSQRQLTKFQFTSQTTIF